MDDVDYLVEDNAMDDFCLSSEVDGTHGRTTSEDDPEQQLLRRAVQGRLAQGGASWERNANVEMFQPSYLPEIQIWLVSGHSRLIKSRKRNESLQHKSMR